MICAVVANADAGGQKTDKLVVLVADPGLEEAGAVTVVLETHGSRVLAVKDQAHEAAAREAVRDQHRVTLLATTWATDLALAHQQDSQATEQPQRLCGPDEQERGTHQRSVVMSVRERHFIKSPCMMVEYFYGAYW